MTGRTNYSGLLRGQRYGSRGSLREYTGNGWVWVVCGGSLIITVMYCLKGESLNSTGHWVTGIVAVARAAVGIQNSDIVIIL